MRILIKNYTFDATNGKVTLDDYAYNGIGLDRLYLIKHVPTKQNLYSIGNAETTVSVLGNVVTLSVDMPVGATDSDELIIIYDDPSIIESEPQRNRLLDSMTVYPAGDGIIVTDSSGKLILKRVFSAPFTAYPQATTTIVPAVQGKKIKVVDLLMNPCEQVSDGIGVATDGSTNAISLGQLGSFGSTLPTKNTLYARLRMKTTATGAGSFGYQHTAVAAKVTLGFNPSGASGKLKLTVMDNAGNKIEATTTSTTNFNDGNLHTIEYGCNISARTLSIIVDGAIQALTYSLQQTLGTMSNFASGFRLGAQFFDGSTINYIAVTIDSFRIGYSSTDLVAAYRMSENTGTTIADDTGNGNIASFQGSSPAPTWVSILFLRKEVKFLSHASSVDLTGNLYNSGMQTINKQFNPQGYFQTVPGEALDISNYSDTLYGGVLNYVLL